MTCRFECFDVEVTRCGIEFMADAIRGILVKCLEKDSRVYTINTRMSFELWTFARGYLGSVMSCTCLGREECFRDMYCYKGTHTSKRNERCSACSLPDKQYVHVIYGGVIAVRVVSYWETGAFVWMDTLRWCDVRMSSVTPVESCLLR